MNKVPVILRWYPFSLRIFCTLKFVMNMENEAFAEYHSSAAHSIKFLTRTASWQHIHVSLMELQEGSLVYRVQPGVFILS